MAFDDGRRKLGRLTRLSAEESPEEDKVGQAQFAGDITLSDEQAHAYKEIKAWISDTQNPIVPYVLGPLKTLGGLAGTGKALAFDQEVQTPIGPRQISGLLPGDLVFGANGHPVSVLGVFPQGERQAYRVTFRDGASVECDLDHLWSVWTVKTRAKGKPPKPITLREIASKGIRMDCGLYRYYIPLCSALQYPVRELPIDPYLLGVLIGDGTHLGGTPTICTSDQDIEIIDTVKPMLPLGMNINVCRRSTCPQYRCVDPTRKGNRLTTALRGLGLGGKLSPERFIPPEYLTAGEEQRWALLRGLMDTDGCCCHNRTSFSTMSPQLAQDICRLVRSLGGTAIANHEARGDWHINVKCFQNPFRLKRKASKWSFSRKNPPSRAIIRIEPTRKCEHVCIKVDTEDGLFVTKDHVVTHNTTLLGVLGSELCRTQRVAFCTLTGKASTVLDRSLRANGCRPDYVGTIHRMMYVPAVDEATGAIIGWTKADKLPYALIVVDEASMIGADIIRDLRAYGVPILAVGDHGQLAPIGEDTWLMKDPDLRLEKVRRQALDNPIIALAHLVREDGDWKGAVKASRDPRVSYLDAFDVTEYVMDAFKDFQNRTFNEDPLVLCGMNKTRSLLNRAARATLCTDELVVQDERIICLRNSYLSGLLLANGFRGRVTEIGHAVNPAHIKVKAVFPDENIELTEGLLSRKQFGAEKTFQTWTEVSPTFRSWQEVGMLCDYGYAMTVHRAQGSQAQNVITLVERMGSASDFQRWIYTAFTRASESLVVAF